MAKRSRKPERTKIPYREVVKRIARKKQIRAKNLTHGDVTLILDTFLDEMLECLVEYEEVPIRGFGLFYRYERAKRRLLHPETKEEIVVAPHFDISFKMGSRMRRKMGLDDSKRRKKKE